MQQAAISFMRLVLFGIKQKAEVAVALKCLLSVLCKYGFQAFQE